MKGKTPELPFKSHFLEVDGSKIHYLDEGNGDPIVFLHGIPTSCYLWRNIIPLVKSAGRCIAPDLIGMGKSDKPDIEYRIFDHIHYIDAFIEQLGLENITLVLHGWGSLIGFNYAMNHPHNVKRIAFFESHVRPSLSLDMASLPMQDRVFLLGDEAEQRRQIIDENYFVASFLKRATLTNLDKETVAYYHQPFEAIEHRKVLWQYFKGLPMGDGPEDVVELMERYSEYLQRSDVPKLMMYAVPGFVTNIETVVWCKAHLKELLLVDLGDAMHFAQETKPAEFAKVLLTWLNLDPVTNTYRGEVLT